MEVGQTATAGQHYNKRWDAAAGERDSFYVTESWKDSSTIKSASRKLGSTGAVTRTWSDGIGTPASSSTPSSHSSLLPIISSDGSMDKVLYQNLVEMIPLVETLMDQQNSKSFPRHASLIYTPTPSRDSLMLKKAVEPKGKRSRSQLVRGKRGEVKDGFFWENAENMYLDSRETYPEEIPMLSFPTDHQVDQNAVNKDIIVRLQGQIEQLEQKLEEKDNQLQAAENSTQQVDLLRLQTNVEDLQKKIASKEQECQKALSQLSEKQHEVAALQSLLEKAEADLEASNLNVAKVQDELGNLQCQVATFLLQMQRISSSLDNDRVDDRPETFPETATSSKDNRQGAQVVAARTQDQASVAETQVSETQGSDTEHVEVTRRKYLASLIAARENPTEGVLLLVSELRAQLQTYVMQPDVNTAPSHHMFGVPSANFALK